LAKSLPGGAVPRDTFFNLPEEKRQLILDLAIEEFSEFDYKNASISSIVNRAGIAKGSFYQYFEDKKDLYLYLIHLLMQEKQRFFAANPPPAEERGIFDQMQWMFNAGLGFEFSNPRFARIGYRAVYGEAPLPEAFRGAVQEGGMVFFKSLVQQGIAQGDIDPEYDPELVAFVFNAILTQLGDYLLRRLQISPERLLIEGGRALDKPEYARLVGDLLHILKRALGAAPLPPTAGELDLAE
jgi:TetR/AcrR family transcriptional regulator